MPLVTTAFVKGGILTPAGGNSRGCKMKPEWSLSVYWLETRERARGNNMTMKWSGAESNWYFKTKTAPSCLLISRVRSEEAVLRWVCRNRLVQHLQSCVSTKITIIIIIIISHTAGLLLVRGTFFFFLKRLWLLWLPYSSVVCIEEADLSANTSYSLRGGKTLSSATQTFTFKAKVVRPQCSQKEKNVCFQSDFWQFH